MTERTRQLKAGIKLVRNSKNWGDYWRGIDICIASIGFDNEEEYNQLEERLDSHFGHILAG